MLCALIVQMPSTATLCSCFSRLTSQLAKSSLDDLGGSENQLDPASALLYEAFADIADCFTAVSLANNILSLEGNLPHLKLALKPAQSRLKACMA